MVKKSAFSVSEMKALWGTRFAGKSKGKNDRIEQNRGGVTYYLFGNEIAHYDPTTRVLEITDAKHRSATTKDRLNGLLPAGRYLFQKEGMWYLNQNNKSVLWPGTYRFRV